MAEKAEKALNNARSLAELVNSMIEDSHDLDLRRLLKQIEADLMDVQHKLAIAVKLVKKG